MIAFSHPVLVNVLAKEARWHEIEPEICINQECVVQGDSTSVFQLFLLIDQN